MALTDARKRANTKWDKDNMATVACKLHREDVDGFKEFAARQGKTANTLLRDYILACLAGEPMPMAEAAPVAASAHMGKMLTLVAGVEGSGKSTFVGSQCWRADFGVVLDQPSAAETDVQTESALPGRLRRYINDGISVTLETALTDDLARRAAKLARSRGYGVRLFYVGMDSLPETLARVSARARRGGADLPEARLRDQFAQRFSALSGVLRLCDEANFYDNASGFSLVGEYRNGMVLPVGEKQALWLLSLTRDMRTW